MKLIKSLQKFINLILVFQKGDVCSSIPNLSLGDFFPAFFFPLPSITKITLLANNLTTDVSSGKNFNYEFQVRIWDLRKFHSIGKLSGGHQAISASTLLVNKRRRKNLFRRALPVNAEKTSCQSRN